MVEFSLNFRLHRTRSCYRRRRWNCANHERIGGRYRLRPNIVRI